jgi:hypothetical protein
MTTREYASSASLSSTAGDGFPGRSGPRIASMKVGSVIAE